MAEPVSIVTRATIKRDGKWVSPGEKVTVDAEYARHLVDNKSAEYYRPNEPAASSARRNDDISKADVIAFAAEHLGLDLDPEMPVGDMLAKVAEAVKKQAAFNLTPDKIGDGLLTSDTIKRIDAMNKDQLIKFASERLETELDKSLKADELRAKVKDAVAKLTEKNIREDQAELFTHAR